MKLTTKQRKIYRVRNNLKKVSKEDRYWMEYNDASNRLSKDDVNFIG